MKATNVYKTANIAEDDCYFVKRYGVKNTEKFIGESIEEARAYVENMAKRDAKSGSLAGYMIENGYCQQIEEYFTVEIMGVA